jgi:hypothetical protein
MRKSVNKQASTPSTKKPKPLVVTIDNPKIDLLSLFFTAFSLIAMVREHRDFV